MSYHKKIVNKKTGKRVDDEKKAINKAVKKNDPIKRNIEKDLEAEENSPMDPPDAYDMTKSIDVSYEQMPAIIQKFIDEHKVGIEKLDSFEKGLIQFKENGYELNDEINDALGEFFKFFENNIMDHNQREEKILFPLLHKRLIESGEHGEGGDPQTAIDMMEDDHIKFIQLGSLAFNLLGLAARLPDQGSKMYVYDVAFSNGQELIELLRLHIYREDHIIFPLAKQLIKAEEFSAMFSA